MATVSFEVETKAEPLLVLSRKGAKNTTVQLAPAGAEKRKGTAEAAVGEKVLLTCIFAGAPGTKYKVTLGPKEKLEVRGSNPIESAIATSELAGSAHRFFTVRS